MIRSMFTAINGLFAQQNYMDVIADNLANVNTQGFKSSSVTFKDQFAQLVQSGAAPTDTLGGQNAIQIGLGTNIGSITTKFTQGPLQSTGRDLDLAIQGDGFFVYHSGTTEYYSRDGSIGIDANGYLVNIATGDQIMGWQADGTGAIDTGAPLESWACLVPDGLVLIHSVYYAVSLWFLKKPVPTIGHGVLRVMLSLREH